MLAKFTRFSAILTMRNKEFWRDRSALAWNILFPVLIVLGFAFAFSDEKLDLYKVGIIGSNDDDTGLEFLHTRHIKFITVSDRKTATTKVERHQLDMLLDTDIRHYWINELSPRGYMLERVLRGAGGAGYEKQTVSGREIRYIDWLVPGVLSMNMMFSALFGVGFIIVRYRKNGVLKRLKATPLTAFEFLAAQVISRLWLILGITTAVYIGSDLIVDFSMFGSYVDLFILFTLGSISMISLSLLVAARVASEELAGGLLNVLSWPMMFLSGVWFSLEGLHPYVQSLAQVFPLTHLIDGSRAIMIDGASLLDVSPQLIVLTLMTAVFLAIGSFSFRWQ